MKRTGLVVMAMMLLAGQVSRGQEMPASVAQAEVEGASFRHAAAPAAVPPMFADHPFGGTGARTCVSSVPDDSSPGGSLRSGDLIVRARLTGPEGLRTGREHKVLWVVYHGSGYHGDTLLVRAVRMGSPSDSLRLAITGLTHHGADFGFPSLVRFPAAGQWLVVATVGDDWGCFLLSVGD